MNHPERRKRIQELEMLIADAESELSYLLDDEADDDSAADDQNDLEGGLG